MGILDRIPVTERKKPLCYDPVRDLFIYWEDLKTRKDKVIPLDRLTQEQVKKLILERLRVGPDFRIGSISGRFYTRDEMVKAIGDETEDGMSHLSDETTMLSELLVQIDKEMRGGG